MSIEDEAERYAKMFEGIDLRINPQIEMDKLIVDLLIEIRNKLDELLEK